MKKRKGNNGYNVATGKYEDLIKAGVVDPTKVTRSALQNAASIAGLLLTTEAIVTEIPEKKEDHPPAGGGGGMAAWAAWTTKRVRRSSSKMNSEQPGPKRPGCFA